MSEKFYLDQAGLIKLVEYIQNSLNNKMNKSDAIVLPDDLVHSEDLVPYALKSDIEDLNIEGYATDEDLARLEGLIQGVYHFRGSVADLSALQAIENPAEGDVYNIADTGMNAAWTGEEWDDFGSIVDLSDYLTKEEVQAITIDELNNILFSGKSAVISDIDSINAMIANEESEVEIILNKNLNNISTVIIPEGKKVVFDFGGNEISVGNNAVINVAGGEAVLKNGTIKTTGTSKADAVIVSDGGKVILDGADVIGAKNNGISAFGEGSEIVINSGSVTAQEAGIYPSEGAKLTINGGSISCIDNGGVMGNGSVGKGNTVIVMNGGRIEGHIQSAGYLACAVYLPNSGSFTMNGGEIVSDGAGIVMRGGQVNLNGGSVIANGATGVTGKVGDSRVVVGPYAIVYDAQSKYPAVDTLELNIADGVILNGTDGDIDTILETGREANITDNRVKE